jgi:NAD(P)-dependent dehydrogenase (short-subunit alcohol dehydrogenase family)
MTKGSSEIALVTGSSRGLGKNAALALARKGVNVIVTYSNNQEEAHGVVSAIDAMGLKAVALRLDTSNTKTFDRFANRLKQSLQNMWQVEQFDFLINDTGIGINKPFEETTEEDFDRLMNVQVKGIFFLTQKLLPLIKDGGRIVNTSSDLARFSLPGYAAHASTKVALEVLTRYLAKEVGYRQITVNVVAPGAIEPDFGGGAVRDNLEISKFITSQTALSRVGVPDDIGVTIAVLLSK